MHKTYESLFRRFQGQPASVVFGFFFFDKDKGENWETPFENLANIAKREEWNFVQPEFRKGFIKFPILANYLNYTFLRLQAQDKIYFDPDGSRCIFNTGLLTPDEKEIFALFDRNFRAGTDDRASDWFFKGFYDSYSREISQYRQSLPELASYVVDASDLVLDTTFDIDVNIGHILDDPENQSRLPELLRNNRNLALAAIEGATKFLKQKVLRNYKVAIPQWYMPEKRIQLLLPLCLVSPEKADLALVADKDKNARLYRIRTALRMDMAYSNARLITKPDREWLNP